MPSFQQNFGRPHLSPDTARSLGLNEYGNPRLDEFSTPFERALLDEVPVRDVKWRSIEKMKARTCANKRAALGYQVGFEVDSPCGYCRELKGPFATCVVVITKSNKLLWEGACASCAYNDKMKSCSFRFRSNDPRLEEYECLSEADPEAASASTESSSYDWTPDYPDPRLPPWHAAADAALKMALKMALKRQRPLPSSLPRTTTGDSRANPVQQNVSQSPPTTEAGSSAFAAVTIPVEYFAPRTAQLLITAPPEASSEVAARLESNNRSPRRSTIEIDVALSPAGPAHLEISDTDISVMPVMPVSSESDHTKVLSSDNGSPHLTSRDSSCAAVAAHLGISSNNPLPLSSPRPTTDYSTTNPFQLSLASTPRTVRTSAGPDYPDTWYHSPLDDSSIYIAAGLGDCRPLMAAYRTMSDIGNRLQYDRRRMERTLTERGLLVEREGSLVERDEMELEVTNPWAQHDDESLASVTTEDSSGRHKRRCL
ncbi:hypothetical protein N7454_001174 [Penicillium verhagenii]|nr:hypothetical protein N7454_001174 [Penicillium verhagenii]